MSITFDINNIQVFHRTLQLRGQANASSMLNGGRTGYVGHGDGVEASGGTADTRRNVGVADCLGNHQMLPHLCADWATKGGGFSSLPKPDSPLFVEGR